MIGCDGSDYDCLSYSTSLRQEGIVVRIDRHRKGKCFISTLYQPPTGSRFYVSPSADDPPFFCLGFNPQKIVWPKYTPTPVTRIIEKYATSYNELAKEFEAHNWANVRRAHTVAEFEKVSRLLLSVIYIYTVILTRSRFRTVTAA